MNFYDENEILNLKKLRIGVLKNFSLENNGVEVSENLAYVVLEEGKNPQYLNIYDITEMLDNIPVFERLPYSNSTKCGEDFGSKLKVVLGEENLKSGPFYVLLKDDLSVYLGKDFMSAKELEEYVINSKYYFKDREDLVLERMKRHPIKMAKILYSDFKQGEKVRKFFEERDIKLSQSKVI